ncbi:MAG: nodulation protein NfeD [Alphaproteobacteria bacterium]|nr:nodulation protein NfeD [Alphaproteobacteria bacterium]
MPRLALIFVTALAVAMVAARAEKPTTVVLLDLKGPIGPAASDYVRRGIERSAEEAAVAVVLRIDTPGGLDTSMREIIRAILASPVPVVGYVAPSGARAASAGTFILYATHIAAMAPGTNVGAATPVRIGGAPQPKPVPADGDRKTADDRMSDGKPQPSPPGSKPSSTNKAIQDAAAYIRSLAQLRDRNADWAEKAVREAASLSASEALAAKVVDLMARDVTDLLARIDGRTVQIGGRSRRLSTKGVGVVLIEPDWRTELLSIVTNPNVAYILLLVGIYGLVFEFSNPGAIVPGVIGGICLLVALYGLHVLPVNYAGLGLLLLGLALMAAEAFAPSFGILGLGGIAAFVIGSLMLFETKVAQFALSWWVVGAVAIVSAGFFMIVLAMLVRAHRRPVVSGAEEMIGSPALVVEWKGANGRVRAHGEIWRARARARLKRGQRVEVTSVDGLTVEVKPMPKKGDE